MTSTHTVRRRVEFCQTDMAGIVHFAEFCTWMEQCEHDLFRHLGHSVHTVVDGVHYGWPRVHVEADFRAPLRFEDEFDVVLRIREVRSRSLVFDFVFNLERDGEQVEVATGSVRTVCVRIDLDGTLHATPIPDAIRARLGAWSPDDPA